MKIKKLMVIEGSHNFAIRIFKETNKFKPKMYKESYRKDQLAISPDYLERTIRHDPPGRWRTKAKNYIDINKNRGA